MAGVNSYHDNHHEDRMLVTTYLHLHPLPPPPPPSPPTNVMNTPYPIISTIIVGVSDAVERMRYVQLLMCCQVMSIDTISAWIIVQEKDMPFLDYSVFIPTTMSKYTYS